MPLFLCSGLGTYCVPNNPVQGCWESENHGLSGARVGRDLCVYPHTPELQPCSLPFLPLLTKEADRLQFKHIWNEKLPVKSQSSSPSQRTELCNKFYLT